MIFEELVGREIRGMAVDAERQHYLRVDTDQGSFYYQTEGDCCSEAWIWAVSGLWYFTRESEYKHRVKSIREVELPPFIHNLVVNDGLCRQDSDAVYSYLIEGEHGGAIEIEFRCSSNGYYGGELRGPIEEPKDVKWIDVPKDYHTSFVADKKLSD